MKHEVITRDWYFNAGIIGFLYVINNGGIIDEKQELIEIHEDSIIFDDKIFEIFEQNYYKLSFNMFFNKISLINKLLNIISKEKNKKLTSEKLYKNEIDKYPYKGFFSVFSSLEKNIDIPISEFFSKIEICIEKLKKYTTSQIFDELILKEKGKLFVDVYLDLNFCNVLSYNFFNKNLKTIKSMKRVNTIKSNDLCISCQKNKALINFNNSISNIIGFNKDNLNWIWGYQSSKLKVCPVCAFIYHCAIFSFSNILKKNKEWQHFFYFINHNSSIKMLYKSVIGLKKRIEEHRDKPLREMIKESVSILMSEKISNTVRNIHFIEIVDNPLLKGKSTRGYNVYSYSINKKIAFFINNIFSASKMPKGSFTIQKIKYDVEEELLLLTIQGKLDYHNIYLYFSYYLSESKSIETYFSINKIVDYVLKFKTYIGGKSMEEAKKITTKGWVCGKELREHLIKKERENQINGLVFQFLNILKIADRDKFLDKYLRVMMSNNMNSRMGKEEMTDKDAFLQFGYSFISGLMFSNHNQSNNEDKKEEGNE